MTAATTNSTLTVEASPTFDFASAWPEVYPAILRRLLARFPHDHQLAEEMCQESLARAFEQHVEDPTFFLTTDLVGWTSRLAQWRSVDVLRRRNRFKPLPEDRDPGAGQLRRLRDNADGGTRRQTWEILLELPPAERVALIAHFYEGRTDQELGTELFGQEGSAQARGLRVWRLRRKACSHLKARLLAEGFDPADLGVTDSGLVGAQAI